MSRVALFILKLICLLAILGAVVWGVGAISFQLPAPNLGRELAAGAFAILGVLAIVGLFVRRARAASVAFAIVFCAMLVWWASIEPSNDLVFAPELANTLKAHFDGDKVTVENVRDFTWRSDTDFTPHWETRIYDLNAVRTVDLYAIYWTGPVICHTIVSFGFADGSHLAFSIEIRRQVNQDYSPIAGFFKRFQLIFIGADERDLLGRSDIRHEQDLLFRIKVSPEAARAFLTQYLIAANELAAKPEFYNTLTGNCTTDIFKLVRQLTDQYPFDWRILVNGYLPEYLYDIGLLNPQYSVADLRRLGRVDGRYHDGMDSAAFSVALRDGVPVAPAASQ